MPVLVYRKLDITSKFKPANPLLPSKIGTFSDSVYADSSADEDSFSKLKSKNRNISDKLELPLFVLTAHNKPVQYLICNTELC
jgi:hypothetical protein